MMVRCLAVGMLAVLGACAAPALATHYVVDLNGGGDFTTIQAAIDARATAFRDTIAVMPGDYAETLVLPIVTQPAWIIGVDGAVATRTISVTLVDGYPEETDRLEGLTFTGDVSFTGDARRCYFAKCVFEGIVDAYGGGGGTANFEDCDFHARTLLRGYLGYREGSMATSTPVFRGLRFHGAPLQVYNGGDGPNGFADCSFEGPADTLVFAYGHIDPVTFERCRFSSGGKGLLYSVYNHGFAHYVAQCVFTDLADAGISDNGANASQGVLVLDSRFERCGNAIRWTPNSPYPTPGGRVELLRDTILASTHEGVKIGRVHGSVLQTIVDGSGSHGAVFLHTMPNDYPPASVTATGSTFTNSGGAGLVVENTSTFWTVPLYAAPNLVTGCTFAHNGEAGLRMTVAKWDVRECVAFDNTGDGIACLRTIAGGGCRLQSNTSVLNQGDGFDVGGPALPADSLQLVRANLAAMNTGAGFRMPPALPGSFAFNDSWGNYLAPYVGGWASLDSNLTADPRFCDLSAGVAGLGLQQGSPCGPSGVYELIGARGEECANTVAVGPGAPGAPAFSVRPSVARGSVEFVAPAGAGEGEGRVELYDLAGRLVWRAALGPATGTVRWHGESERGRAAAGLYWARFTRGEERATRRLVWLE